MLPHDELPQLEVGEIKVVDQRGAVRLLISPASGITLWDRNEVKRASMSGFFGFEVWDMDGTRRARMTRDGLDYMDEGGTKRAQVGATDDPILEAEAEGRQLAAVVLYDAEGNVTWQAPR